MSDIRDMSDIPAPGPAPMSTTSTSTSTVSRGAGAFDDPAFADGYVSGDTTGEIPVHDPSGVDLSTDPFADNLSAELEAAAPQPWRNRATYVLGALVLVAAGFVGGVQVEKHLGSTATAANARTGAAAAFAGARGAGGGFGRGGGANGGTPTSGASASASTGTAATQTNTGKVTLVDGSTVYVTLASGDVLTVKTTSATKISVGSVTKVSGLKVGASVTVTGPTDANGNVTATSITAGS